MWCAYLNLLNRLSAGLNDSTLTYLVIIIVILHLLIVYVSLGLLLLQLLILDSLYVGVLYYNLFILLLYHALVRLRILTGLLDTLMVSRSKTCLSFLLFWNTLLLFRWALITIVIIISIIK